MRPIDPRLIGRAAAARGFLVAGALIGLLQTFATIAFSWFTAQVIAGAVAGNDLAASMPALIGIACAIIVRAFAGWAMASSAAAAAARVKVQLRAAAVGAISVLGPEATMARSSARIGMLLGAGLDALDGYFGRYLPQLILTALATPILVLTIGFTDILSGIIIVLTLPLIPLFMMLVGWATQSVQKKQWAALQTLSASFLEVVGGFATLKIFGRAHRQRARMAAVSGEYRDHTMRVLRVSFLSGFVLELAASLSVAIVAVEIGLRLLDGGLSLEIGLFVLLLAPEAFLPVRGVGTQFHAAADGVAASEELLSILDEADAAAESSPLPVAASAAGSADSTALSFTSATIARDSQVVLSELTATAPAGEFSVVTGPSGAGKTSLLRAVLGFAPSTGISFRGEPVDAEIIAYAPQSPGLLAGSLAQNIALGDDIDLPAVRNLLAELGLGAIDPETILGAQGAGLSGGQAQRVSLARALYRLRRGKLPVLLVDEPSSALDADAERLVIDALRAAADRGAVVIAVTHRSEMIAAADHVIAIGEPAHV